MGKKHICLANFVPIYLIFAVLSLNILAVQGVKSIKSGCNKIICFKTPKLSIFASKSLLWMWKGCTQCSSFKCNTPMLSTSLVAFLNLHLKPKRAALTTLIEAWWQMLKARGQEVALYLHKSPPPGKLSFGLSTLFPLSGAWCSPPAIRHSISAAFKNAAEMLWTRFPQPAPPNGIINLQMQARRWWDCAEGLHPDVVFADSDWQDVY